MVVIKGVSAKAIFDSRKEKTILVSIKTNQGVFTASAPNGKSKGKHEAISYKKDINGDIKTLKQFSSYFSEDEIEKFEDLRRIEDIVDRHIGANTLFALESAVLKALAKEKKKQVWQLINPNAKKLPRLVGNCVGGGLHSEGKKPDFQEFLLIPHTKTLKEAFEINKKAKKEIFYSLKDKDNKFQGKRNDEDAWQTVLNEKEVLDILRVLEIPLGVDIAASSFYGRKKYIYHNPALNRDSEEQISYIGNLIKNFSIFYIEDPFSEEDFSSFAKLLQKNPQALIVGDDLTVTNGKRLQKAIEEKSINAIIVKPNQNGSLIEVKEICETAKKHGIKIVFSHRSGETKENILADLAFGFQADFFKCGITGPERESKMKRLIEIERKLGK
jgi:enolase